jgi:tetratricopeptide (TPR) repeat protein
MDEANILLAHLYNHLPKGVDRRKIDAAWSDYEIAKSRGEPASFASVLVKRRILGPGDAERIVADEKRAYAKTDKQLDQGKKKGEPREKAKAPAKPRPPEKKPEPPKPREPARETAEIPIADAAAVAKAAASKRLLVNGAILAIVVVLAVVATARFVGPTKKPVDESDANASPIARAFQSAPDVPADPSAPLAADPAAKAIRDALDAARTGAPGDAEKKLKAAIDKATTPEEKERLEHARWRIQETEKARASARETLKKASELAKAGKLIEARALLQLWLEDNPDDDSPEAQEIKDALYGVGRWGDLFTFELDGRKKPRDPTKKDDGGEDANGGTGKDGDLTITSEERKKRKKKREEDEARGESVLGGDLVVLSKDDDDKDDDGKTDDGTKGQRPTHEPGTDGTLVIEEPPPAKTKKTYKGGQRPVGEPRGDGQLVIGLVDEVDEEPDPGETGEKPETVERPVPPIPIGTPKPVEPERADALAAVASAEGVYYEKTLAWLNERRAERSNPWEREAALAKKRSHDSPLEFDVPGAAGMKISEAVVTRYDRAGFMLKGKNMGWGSDWSRNPQISLEVRKLGARSDVASDQLRLGRWLAVRRHFPEAKKAFEKAIQIDGTVREKVPNLDLLASGTQVFRGRISRTSEQLHLTYPFDSPDELGDFNRLGTVSVARGRLYLGSASGEKGFVELGREVGFLGHFGVEGDLVADQTGGTATLGLELRYARNESSAPENEVYALAYSPTSGVAIFYDLKNGGTIARGRAGHHASNLRLEVRGGTLEARVGTFSGFVPLTLPASSTASPILGGSNGVAVFKELVLAGKTNPMWVRKTFGAMDSVLPILLRAEAIGAPRWAYTHEPVPLSGEIGTIDSLSEAVRKRYEKGERHLAQGTISGLTHALGDFARVAMKAPGFGPAHYHLAECALKLRKLGPALHELNRAVAATGGFVEAVALRAQVLCQLKRFEEADKDLALAESWRPDSFRVRRLGGAVRFEEARLDEAKDELELAFALEPLDREGAAKLDRVSQVVEGPAWDNPQHVDTEHFSITSDLTPERLKLYSQQLEWIRPVYESGLGMKPEASVAARRSHVLIFESDVTYFSYNASVHGAALESTLGVFYPDVKQLLLFERAGDTSGKLTTATLLHEGFHQYFDMVVDWSVTPGWASEGLAEYFGATTIDNGAVTEIGGLQRERLRTMTQYNRIWPIDELMTAPYSAYQDDTAPFRYAQAWSVCHYLMEGDQARWKPLLRRYLENLRAGRTPANAYNRTFGRIDMDALEAGWRLHQKGLLEQAARSQED